MLAGHQDDALAEEIAPLAADQHELDCHARAFRLEALRALDQVGIEGARQALVAGDQDEQDALLGAPREQRVFLLMVVAGDGRRQVAEYLAQERAVGPCPDGAILRTAQFRRRDHLHGLGDLLRIFDRADAPPDIDQTRHELVPLGSPPGSELKAPIRAATVRERWPPTPPSRSGLGSEPRASASGLAVVPNLAVIVLGIRFCRWVLRQEARLE